jgi:hypothetical protein
MTSPAPPVFGSPPTRPRCCTSARGPDRRGGWSRTRFVGHPATTTGPQSENTGSLTRSRRWPPPASITQISPSSCSKSSRYAIWLASGARVGSNPPSLVSCRRFRPSASLVQIPSSKEKAIVPDRSSRRTGRPTCGDSSASVRLGEEVGPVDNGSDDTLGAAVRLGPAQPTMATTTATTIPTGRTVHYTIQVVLVPCRVVVQAALPFPTRLQRRGAYAALWRCARGSRLLHEKDNGHVVATGDHGRGDRRRDRFE